MAAYLRDVLKFPAKVPYIAVNFSVNAKWRYDDAKKAMVYLGEALRAHPHMRLFWAAGYYDLTTPAYEARYTLDQDGVPAKQLTAEYFPGPHGVYAVPNNLARFTAAIRRFVTAPAASRRSRVVASKP